VLILEGPDCGGKTVLAKKLVKKYDAHHTHYDAHHRMRMLAHAVDGEPGLGEIVDRFHYSEIPYSLYYRKVKPDYVGTSMINRALLARQAVTILCLPPWGEVKRNWHARKENELIQSENILRRIYKWYDNMPNDGIPVVKYDYTSDKLKHIVENVEALMNARPASNIIKGQPSGRFYSAKVLLVGEMVGNSIQREVPFTGIKASGPWFTQQLLDAEIQEKDLAWINVQLYDGISNMINVVKACETYKYDHVIALGATADAALRRKHIQHESAYHPQYWNRFHSKEEYHLINRLKEII